jgi:CP family cyanate transporter-like MFS transporter
LAALNLGQLPASFALLAFANRYVGKRMPLAVTGALAGVSVGLMLVTTSTLGIVLLAVSVGFAAAFSLILTLSIPPLLAPDHDVHRFAAGQLAIGYAIAFVLPVISGAVWDATHAPSLAFLIIAVSGVLIVLLAAGLRMPEGKL